MPLCIPEQRMQIKTPMFQLAHLGSIDCSDYQLNVATSTQNDSLRSVNRIALEKEYCPVTYVYSACNLRMSCCNSILATSL